MNPRDQIQDGQAVYEEMVKLLEPDKSNGPRHSRLFLPTLARLEVFGAWFLENHWPYMQGQFTCVDFVLRAIDRMTESIVRNDQIRDCSHSMGFAEIWIPDGKVLNDVAGDPGKNHETCLIKTFDAGWIFWEPQSNRHCPARAAIDRGDVGTLAYVWM